MNKKFVFQEEIENYIVKVGLTMQEQNVFWLIIEGKSLKEMAKELIISTSAATKHCTKVYSKLGITGKHQVIPYILEIIKNETDISKNEVIATSNITDPLISIVDELEERLLSRFMNVQIVESKQPAYSFPIYHEDGEFNHVGMIEEYPTSYMRERKEERFDTSRYH